MNAKFAVIFKAQLKAEDQSYQETAARMRQKAIEEYGCLNFVSVNENNQEISISYWESEQAILNWKRDPEHKDAQQKGAARWYRNYTVEVVELKRAYSFKI
ncbi:MAG: antibiotic biosynthesis monooxygenase [Neptuniibacter sp.]